MVKKPPKYSRYPFNILGVGCYSKHAIEAKDFFRLNVQNIIFKANNLDKMINLAKKISYYKIKIVVTKLLLLFRKM